MSDGVELRVFMATYCRKCGSPEKAAKNLNVHLNVVNEVISGKRTKLPSYCLKKIGLRQVVTLVPIDEPA